MPVEVKKCVATPTRVTVHFSGALDFPVNPNAPAHPNRIENYAVSRSGIAVAIASAQYNVSNWTTELQLGAVLTRGTLLQITVFNVTSGGSPIALGASCPATVEAEEKLADAKPSSTQSTAEDIRLDQLRKIVQPAYAIGMNLITRDDYNNLKNQYFALSELSLGLILPMVLIVLGLAMTPQLGLAPPDSLLTGPFWPPQQWLPLLAWLFMCLAMIWISEALFVIGAERYQKFRLEVKLLIEGNWKKQQDTKKDASKDSAASPTAIQKAVAKAITDARLEQGTLRVNIDAKS